MEWRVASTLSLSLALSLSQNNVKKIKLPYLSPNKFCLWQHFVYILYFIAALIYTLKA